jgi:hypothetical protein
VNCPLSETFSVLGACLLASKLLLGGEAGTWAAVLRESLTIAGWVAMWRPMQIYLYDWWPVRRRGRVYSKLSRMRVEVLRKERAESSQRGGSGPRGEIAITPTRD